jgi:hypothetical protein
MPSPLEIPASDRNLTFNLKSEYVRSLELQVHFVVVTENEAASFWNLKVIRCDGNHKSFQVKRLHSHRVVSCV